MVSLWEGKIPGWYVILRENLNTFIAHLILALFSEKFYLDEK